MIKKIAKEVYRVRQELGFPGDATSDYYDGERIWGNWREEFLISPDRGDFILTWCKNIRNKK